MKQSFLQMSLGIVFAQNVNVQLGASIRLIKALGGGWEDAQAVSAWRAGT